MVVALATSHKPFSVSACHLKDGDAITDPPHTSRLAVFKFLKSRMAESRTHQPLPKTLEQLM